MTYTNGQFEMAMKAAASACKMDIHIFHPRMKSALHLCERQDVLNYHNFMPLKRSFMNCDHLDMTFFFDEDGNAKYVYSGYVDANGEADKVIKAFDTAEKMRVFMNRYLEQIAGKDKEKIANELVQ